MRKWKEQLHQNVKYDADHNNTFFCIGQLAPFGLNSRRHFTGSSNNLAKKLSRPIDVAENQHCGQSNIREHS